MQTGLPEGRVREQVTRFPQADSTGNPTARINGTYYENDRGSLF